MAETSQSVTEKLTAIQALQAEEEQEKADSQKRVETLREKIHRQTKDLATSVLNGESTGDRVWDYLLAKGTVDPKEEERYRAIDEALRGHTGELVLIHYLKEQGIKHVMVPRPGHESTFDTITCFKLGVLTNDELILVTDRSNPSDSFCSLPVAKHVTRDHAPVLVEGAISESGSILDPCTYWLLGEAELPPRMKPSYVSRIVIGDEAVREWFKTQRFGLHKLYDECVEALKPPAHYDI